MAKPDDAADLAAELAEKVFGWRDVHRHERKLVGKKPDKLGRFRNARVPDYLGDPSLAYAIDERMKQLGHDAAYRKRLDKMTKAQKLPLEWATAEQKARAALALCSAQQRQK